jgi:hypothetical protein
LQDISANGVIWLCCGVVGRKLQRDFPLGAAYAMWQARTALADYPEVYGMATSSSPTHQGSRRPVAVFGTLLPHMHPGRHHVYRDVVALALLVALFAAAVPSLSVALVLTAVALPAAVLVYIHDHRLWHDEPITVIVVAFGLSLLLGVGVGLLETYFVGPLMVTGATSYQLPPVEQIVKLGLLVPAVAFVAVLISPLIVSARPAFRHPFDVVVAASLSGAALSLGLSVVVQKGAFNHVQITAGDPAHVAFIALTLGFLQPIVLATAATVAVLGVRRLGVSPVVGVIEGLALVVVYELATTLLEPDGARGIVLTALTAFVLAGVGLVAVRNGLHAAITADTGAAGDAAGAGHVQHRLHGGLVAAVVALVVLIAAVIAVVVDWSGPSTRPKLPKLGPGGIVSHAAGVGSLHPMMGQSGQSPWGNLTLASHTTSLATGSGSAITLYNSVSITPAPGWTATNPDQGEVNLVSSNNVIVGALAGEADQPNITQEASEGISGIIKGAGMTNVQQEPVGSVQTIQGKNFQQLYAIAYTGNIQSNQGTTALEGYFTTLFNSSTHTAGGLNVVATNDAALQAATSDVKSMLQSME